MGSPPHGFGEEGSCKVEGNFYKWLREFSRPVTAHTRSARSGRPKTGVDWKPPDQGN